MAKTEACTWGKVVAKECFVNSLSCRGIGDDHFSMVLQAGLIHKKVNDVRRADGDVATKRFLL